MENLLYKTNPFIQESAQKVFSKKKIALFIVAYNAEKYIEKTITRIPHWCQELFAEIYVIDDSSKDNTSSVALATGEKLGLKNFSVMKTPHNQGYGGNQKIGYTYAIQNNYDIIILLHGDGQYPPECLPNLVAGYANSEVDAVFGSRMMIHYDALRGGMPFYKWIGNQILTRAENYILGTNLSEFHSGYRSYKISTLKKIPFNLNSDDFHFDTDIIIQLVLGKSNILEIPMPTHYGNEKCHVNGMKYAWNCFKSATKARLHQAGVFFQPNFELPENINRNYKLKIGKTSLHSYILTLPWEKKEKIVDLGANDGLLSQKIAEKGSFVTAVDINIPENVPDIKTIKLDLNENFEFLSENYPFDKIIALDIIEHLNSPEIAAKKIHRILKSNGILYASTANIGYVIMRLTHLIGWFNYGKKGILDQTHHRLFTIHSFRRLLRNSGFKILKIEGFGPPIIDAFGKTYFWIIIDRICWLLAKIHPPLFAFNFLIIAQKEMSVNEKTTLTINSQQK